MEKFYIFVDDTIRYDISISKSTYRYFWYIESSLVSISAAQKIVQHVIQCGEKILMRSKMKSNQPVYSSACNQRINDRQHKRTKSESRWASKW